MEIIILKSIILFISLFCSIQTLKWFIYYIKDKTRDLDAQTVIYVGIILSTVLWSLFYYLNIKY